MFLNIEHKNLYGIYDGPPNCPCALSIPTLLVLYALSLNSLEISLIHPWKSEVPVPWPAFQLLFSKTADKSLGFKSPLFSPATPSPSICIRILFNPVCTVDFVS